MLLFFTKSMMFVHMFVGLILIAIILLQRGRGGGLAGAFGGMGGQSAFGTKAGDVFTKITIYIASVWIVLGCICVVMASNFKATKPQKFIAGAAAGAKADADDKKDGDVKKGGDEDTAAESGLAKPADLPPKKTEAESKDDVKPESTGTTEEKPVVPAKKDGDAPAPKASGDKPDESAEKPKETPEKPEAPAEKPKEPEAPKEPAAKPEEATEKPAEPTEKKPE